MSAYITTMATPTYVISTDGFYKHSGTTLPSGTELTVKSKGIDNKSDREVGYLANGTIVYLDRLQPRNTTTGSRSAQHAPLGLVRLGSIGRICYWLRCVSIQKI